MSNFKAGDKVMVLNQRGKIKSIAGDSALIMLNGTDIGVLVPIGNLRKSRPLNNKKEVGSIVELGGQLCEIKHIDGQWAHVRYIESDVVVQAEVSDLVCSSEDDNS